MTVPVNSEKELNDWTFDELVKWACWVIVEGMTQGKPLRSSVYSVLDVARQWDPKKGSKQ